MTHSAQDSTLILFYDGYCALCNGAVRFLLRADRRAVMKFAPLHGPLAQSLLDRYPELRSIDSVILFDRTDPARETISLRSDAVLNAVACLGGMWRLASILRIVPRPVREAVYDRVAVSRYRLLRRFEACPLPPPHFRDRFLD